MAQKKRKHERRRSPHRINVLSAHDDAVLGRLVNITPGGLMFLSQHSFDGGQEVLLRIPLPSMVNDRGAIDVTGRVAWQGDDSNPRFHRIGIEFLDLGSEEAYVIESVLQRLHLVG